MDIKQLIKEKCPNGVEHIALGSLFKREKEKAGNNCNINVVYAISNKEGIVNSDEYHEASIYSKDTSNYYIIRKGMFAYNPARLNIGSIAYLKEDIPGLLSPMYIVFSIDESKITQGYLMALLKSSFLKSKIVGLTEVGARFRFDFDRWNRIIIPIPPIEIQNEIVKILSKFTELEKELEAEMEARKKQYQYYRDKLLTFEKSAERERD